jgi:hypothetical protein
MSTRQLPIEEKKCSNPISMIQSCGPGQTILQSGCKSNAFEGAEIMVSLTSIQIQEQEGYLKSVQQNATPAILSMNSWQSHNIYQDM